jgi:cytochrome P450
MFDPTGFFKVRSNGSDLFRVKLPGMSVLYVTGCAEGAREIHSAPPDTFRTFTGSPIDMVFGSNSMMAVDGVRHQRQRRMIMPSFGPGRTMEFARTFATIAETKVNSMVNSREYSLQRLMQDLALDVIVEVIFGVRASKFKDEFLGAIFEFVRRATPSVLLIPRLRTLKWPPWRRFLSAQARLDRCLSHQVNEIRSQGTQAPDCLLKTMLNTADPSGDRLRAEELRDELRMLLVAGHETTATALTWAFYYTMANPSIYDRLCAEVRSADGTPAQDVALPYLEAVCKEALRIHSVPPLSFRTLREPLTVRGKLLPPGTNVALSLLLLHQQESVFPKGHRFIPERFLDKKYSLYEYMPFGGGARRCIASSFAMTEMQVVMATMLRQADFRLLSDSRPRLVLHHINTGPDRKIPVAMTRRLKTQS